MKKHIYFLLQVTPIKTLLIHDNKGKKRNCVEPNYTGDMYIGGLIEIAPFIYYSESVSHLLLYYAYLHIAKLKAFQLKELNDT